jgi:hypothetical protein
MARIAHLHRHPNGPRVWLLGQRIHHGAVGVLLALACVVLGAYLGVLLAVALVAHDAHDWRIWFTREGLPASASRSGR